MKLSKLLFKIASTLPPAFILYTTKSPYCQTPQSYQTYDPKFYVVEDSDYLDLEVKPSKIPHAGMGLFARKSYEAGEIIAEYRGPILDSKFINDKMFDDESKMLYINEKYSIIGKSIAGYANDCVIFPEKMSEGEYQEFKNNEGLKLHPNCAYNAKLDDTGNKIFLIAERKIEAGEEIYVSYGFDYWDFFIKKKFFRHKQ